MASQATILPAIGAPAGVQQQGIANPHPTPGPHGFCEWTFCIICMVIMAPFYCFYLLLAALFRICWRLIVNYRNHTARLVLTRKLRPIDPKRRQSISFEMVELRPKKQPPRQSPSFFLDRLPTEIRIMIYEHALGGQNFHIVHGRKRMTALPCVETFPLASADQEVARRAYYEAAVKFKRGDHYTRSLPRRWSEPMRQRKFHLPCIEPFIDRKTMLARDEANKAPMKGKRFGHRLALLKTCKLIYIEAVNILYANNTFIFHHPEDLHLWSITVPKSRWTRITSLEFLLCGSVPPRPRFQSVDMSAKVFPVLKEMMQLRRLRVVPSMKLDDSPIIYALLTFELLQSENDASRPGLKIDVDWMTGAGEPAALV